MFEWVVINVQFYDCYESISGFFVCKSNKWTFLLFFMLMGRRFGRGF